MGVATSNQPYTDKICQCRCHKKSAIPCFYCANAHNFEGVKSPQNATNQMSNTNEVKA